MEQEQGFIDYIEQSIIKNWDRNALTDYKLSLIHILIPTHTKSQFAGNMGLLSFGTGWDYGRRNQWETDVFFGVLPRCV